MADGLSRNYACLVQPAHFSEFPPFLVGIIVCCITSFFVKKLLISIIGRSGVDGDFYTDLLFLTNSSKKKIELCNKLSDDNIIWFSGILMN